MQIKTPVEFQTYNDGVIDIYETDDNGELLLIPKFTDIHFEKRIIGAMRSFVAAQEDIKFTDLIRIPCINSISNYDMVIMGGCKYEIKQIQNIFDTNPPSIDLSLNKKGGI